MSSWTVSLDNPPRSRGGYRCAVYCDGRRVLGGWDSSANAEWSLTYLRRGACPPYRPGSETIAWPAAEYLLGVRKAQCDV